MFGDISWDDDGTGEGSGFLSMSEGSTAQPENEARAPCEGTHGINIHVQD